MASFPIGKLPDWEFALTAAEAAGEDAMLGIPTDSLVEVDSKSAVPQPKTARSSMKAHRLKILINGPFVSCLINN
jgi:hypothetical protein